MTPLQVALALMAVGLVSLIVAVLMRGGVGVEHNRRKR